MAATRFRRLPWPLCSLALLRLSAYPESLVVGEAKRPSACLRPLLVQRLLMLLTAATRAPLVSPSPSLVVLSVTVSSTDPRETLKRMKRLAAADRGLGLVPRAAVAAVAVPVLPRSLRLVSALLVPRRFLTAPALAVVAAADAPTRTIPEMDPPIVVGSAAEVAALSTVPATASPS